MVESGNIGFKLRATMMHVIFRKSMIMSNAARQQTSVGQVVNLMANDAQRFCEFMNMLNDMLLCAPFLSVSLVLVYSMLGPATLAGVAVLAIGMFVNSNLTRRLKALRSQQMGQTDQRVLQINEALLSIRVVKSNCWEEPIAHRISEFRKIELQRIRSMERLMACLKFNSFAIPVLLALVTFSAYAASGGVMRAADIFTAMALFSMVQQYMSMLPNALGTLGQLLVSQKRLEDYLKTEEQPVGGAAGVERQDEGLGSTAAGEVRINSANFSWGGPGSQQLDLHGISFEAAQGELVAVVGAVGSGKSSLLSACLGEMSRSGGSHTLRGSASLCAQQPWLASGTLRENVIMGAPFDHERYWRAVRCCGLLPDLEQLPEGDRTAIGNRGINLSGGQKQRIALARAVYRQAGMVFLDDVLAAVDVHVGKLIFEQCICGAMSGSTRILVTNQMQYMQLCDRVVVMDSGKIVEAGSCAELLSDPMSMLTSMMGDETDSPHSTPTAAEGAEAAEKADDATTPKSEDMEKAMEGKTAKKDGVLETKEERKAGKVMLSVYSRWLRFGSSNFGLLIMFLFGFLGSELFNIGAQLWIGVWAEAASVCGADATAASCAQLMEHSTVYYVSIYALISFAACVLYLWRNWRWASNVVQAASALHERLLMNVLRLPIMFFDQTPTGRIINRFASDIDMIDTTLSGLVQRPIELLLKGSMALAVTASVIPPLIVPLAMLVVPYLKIRELFRRSDRELRRLDSTTRSPIFAHFSEMLGGVSTLRAFSHVGSAVSENKRLLAENLQTAFHQRQVHGWVSLRLDLVGAALTLAASCSCILFRSTLTPSICGLLLLQLSQAIRYYRWAAKISVDVESKMVYVERVLQYIDLEPEPPLRLPDTDPAPGAFPSNGAVEFEKVCLRYRPGLPLALQDASFTIPGGSKCGICGRTGAGKSTLAAALFRLTELASGRIFIDGVDIRSLGLHCLRHALAVVPQDPALFTGSLRDNLDPFKASTTEELAVALEQVGLSDFVSRQIGGIDCHVTEGGSNLSVGQRQLLCMARALLRNSAVMLMDEATANVDMQTDRHIQRSTRTLFTGTVLTIAHRLHTIMDCDSIVVLESGRVAEFGTPAALADTQGGALQLLVDGSGPEEAAKLRAIARSAAHGEVNARECS
jgi:ABC-type multidrug transport system fused ATPase/permease subunit